MVNRPQTNQLIESLKKSPFFADLNQQTLSRLANRAVWREYSTGEIVVLEGEALSGLYLLQHGWLKVVKISVNGREQVLRHLEPGETFNEVGVFANHPNPATAVALEPVGVWHIRRDVILGLLRENPKFAELVLEKMADRLLYLVSMVTDLSLRPVTGRLARLLLEESDGDTLARPRWYTQAELAARLGTVPDVVQRALRNLEKNGLIEVQRRSIRVLDEQALHKMIQ